MLNFHHAISAILATLLLLQSSHAECSTSDVSNYFKTPNINFTTTYPQILSEQIACSGKVRKMHFYRGADLSSVSTDFHIDIWRVVSVSGGDSQLATFRRTATVTVPIQGAKPGWNIRALSVAESEALPTTTGYFIGFHYGLVSSPPIISHVEYLNGSHPMPVYTLAEAVASRPNLEVDTRFWLNPGRIQGVIFDISESLCSGPAPLFTRAVRNSQASTEIAMVFDCDPGYRYFTITQGWSQQFYVRCDEQAGRWKNADMREIVVFECTMMTDPDPTAGTISPGETSTTNFAPAGVCLEGPGYVPHAVQTMTLCGSDGLCRYGDRYIYNCQNGYVNKGFSNHAVCLPDSSWDITVNCAPIECGEFTIPPYAISISQDGITLGSTIVLRCEAGRQPRGGIKYSCMANKVWAPVGTTQDFECYDPGVCGLVPKPENAYVYNITFKDTSHYGDKVHFACAGNSVQIGSGEAVCSVVNNAWSVDQCFHCTTEKCVNCGDMFTIFILDLHRSEEFGSDRDLQSVQDYIIKFTKYWEMRNKASRMKFGVLSVRQLYGPSSDSKRTYMRGESTMGTWQNIVRAASQTTSYVLSSDISYALTEARFMAQTRSTGLAFGFKTKIVVVTTTSRAQSLVKAREYRDWLMEILKPVDIFVFGLSRSLNYGREMLYKRNLATNEAYFRAVWNRGYTDFPRDECNWRGMQVDKFMSNMID